MRSMNKSRGATVRTIRDAIVPDVVPRGWPQAASFIGITLEEYVENRRRGLKWCSWHRGWRPLSDFGSDLSRTDGLQPRCRHCCRMSNRRRESVFKYVRKYRPAMPEHKRGPLATDACGAMGSGGE